MSTLHNHLAQIAATGLCTQDEAREMARLLLEAKSRASDPGTSQAAAKTVMRMTDKRQAVLEAFQYFGPMTDEQLHDAYEERRQCYHWPEQSASGLRTRRSELVRMGALEDAGTKRRMRTGRWAVLWGLRVDT